MRPDGRRLLLCNCERSMRLDPQGLAQALVTDEPFVHSGLCTTQAENFKRAAAGDAPLLIGCTQEAPLFLELAEESGLRAPLAFVNIRERAGWSDQGDRALAKMAALIAEAAVDVAPTPSITMKSDGVVLVYGRDEIAVGAARRLAGRLNVSCLLRPPVDLLPPPVMDVPIFCGRVRQAGGHLGAFELNLDGFAAYQPASRREITFGPPRDGMTSTCDLIVDLSGDPPLFPAPDAREGYFRAEPGDAVGVERLLFDVAEMVGDFEKPRYVRLDPSICVHSRNRIVGCRNCLDVCPTGAIVPDGDHVAIDPFICAGHGSCAGACPTGAIAFDKPAGGALFERLRVLSATYRRAGGTDLVLLVHDADFGDAAIVLTARAGRGLPAHVVPFAVHEIFQIGADFLLTALAYGVAQVRILAGPKQQRDGLEPLRRHAELVAAIVAGLGYAGERVVIDEIDDPAALEDRLYRATPPLALRRPATHLATGGKRTMFRLALERLHAEAPHGPEVIELPAGAPFGLVVLDHERCTLCLACVGACPVAALGDDPDKPRLTFTEINCVQCGLCRATCPENAIALRPRLNLAEQAGRRIVLKEEEPFRCSRCGKPFASQTTIDKLLGRLADHPMFATPERRALLTMCEDCRVIAQFDEQDVPLAAAPRPRPRTTDDYLRARQQTAGRRGDGEDGA